MVFVLYALNPTAYGTAIRNDSDHKPRALLAFVLTAWRTAASLWCVPRNGHPGRRTPAPLAVPLRESFQRDYRFANLIPLLA
jgi:hypothetical protein